MNSLTVAFSDLFSFIQNNIGTVTTYFTELFDDPVQSIKDFGTAIKDNLIERFMSFLDTIGFLASAVKKLFAKDFQGALDDVKKEFGVVVWCKYRDCINNKEIKGLQRTSGTLLKKRGYIPLNEQEAVWSGICTRDEIAIKYDEVRSAGGAKFKVPTCFVAATNKTGHMDFSRLLQPDGSPFGGNIDSQHVSSSGYEVGG